MCQNEKIREIFTWKLFFIHIVDDRTIQNGILSTGGWLIRFKNYFVSHSSFKTNAENAHKYMK